MSEQEKNLAIAREGLEDFRRGDIDAFLEKLDPGVAIYSPPDRANPANYRGREGWLQWTGDWLEAWESFEFVGESFETVGEHHVVMTIIQRGVGKGSGVEVEMPAHYMLEYHDGLATRVHLYPDREQALEAARAGEERAAGKSQQY
jgi:ketosteroid isomerase-like protein